MAYSDSTASASDAVDVGVQYDSIRGEDTSGIQNELSSAPDAPGYYLSVDDLYSFLDGVVIDEDEEYGDFDFEKMDYYSLASDSDVSLVTIHEDLQILNLNIMLMYSILAVLFLVKKGRF